VRVHPNYHGIRRGTGVLPPVFMTVPVMWIRGCWLRPGMAGPPVSGCQASFVAMPVIPPAPVPSGDLTRESLAQLESSYGQVPPLRPAWPVRRSE